MPEVFISGRRLAYEAQPVSLDPSVLSVLFVHSSGADREEWRAQLEGLSGVIQMIALELPGHGASDPRVETTVPAYAGYVVNFVETLGLQKVMLVGCSLGSAIVQWIALSPGPWLSAIGLVGAGARLRVLPALLDGLSPEGEPLKYLAMMSEFCLSPSTGEPIRSMYKEKCLRTPPELLRNDLLACNEFDVMERIGEVSLPTWIIVGEDDKLTPMKYARFLHEHISGSRLSIIPGAGHLVMMEKPKDFNEHLGQFLADIGLIAES
jgi:pimeloyl-ACP methyl ester carboxylesterase